MSPHSDKEEEGGGGRRGYISFFFFFFFSRKKFQVFVNLEKYSSRVFGPPFPPRILPAGRVEANSSQIPARIILTKLTLSCRRMDFSHLIAQQLWRAPAY